jgi:lipid-A-disaccharide synthase
MASSLDLLITIFPFEKKCFDATGLNVEFAGHPLVDEAATVLSEPHFTLPWKGATRIALLPGSRRHVVEQVFPTMWRAAGLYAAEHADAGFIVAAPSVETAGLIDFLARRTHGGPANWSVVVGQAREVLRQARAAMVVSGTSTVEAALMRCPMLIVYRMPELSYWLGRMLVKVDHIGMVNIVAGRRLCPEFVQHEAKPGALSSALGTIVGDGPAREKMLAGFEEVRAALGSAGADARAADAVLSVLR